MLLLGLQLVSASTNDAIAFSGPGLDVSQDIVFYVQSGNANVAFDDIGFSSGRIHEPTPSSFIFGFANSGALYITGHNIEGKIWLKDYNYDYAYTSTDETYGSFSENDIPSNYQDLVVYDVCYAGSFFGSDTTDQGTSCVLGWTGLVMISDSTCWSEAFFDCLDDENDDIEDCSDSALSSCSIASYKMGDYGSCNFVLTR